MTRAAALLCALLIAASASAQDRREGYYYPEITSEETFDRAMMSGPVPDPAAREAFLTFLTRAQLDAPETPSFALFAKGGASQHLILVALQDGPFRTLYRARGVLAQLTYNLRGTPFFRERKVAATATFFDMLVLLGFETLTVSDGVSWSHRVVFADPPR